jgi:transposase InsO family protein
MIKELRLHYPVLTLCDTLAVSESGYYDWLTRKPSRRQQEEARLEMAIKAAHRASRGTHGPKKLREDLAAQGIKSGECRIRRLRKKLGIRCIQKKKYKATTDSKHSLPVAANLLNQQFEATAPNQIWLSDITYIPTEEGWLYLAAHKDLFSREIVGYAMSDRMTKELVSRSLCRAVSIKRPCKGLLHHSDRGSQYCSYDYRSLLEQFGMRVSMSGKGNCYDNAPMENFWGVLKSELVHHRRYKTRAEAIREITEYIEIFYNRQRRQQCLGFLSPAAFLQTFHIKGLAA